MKKADSGIVLSRVSYSETSSVIKCFTKEYGLKSFLIQGSKKKYASVIQAMMPIEFTFYQKKDELAKIYEPALFLPISEVQFDHLKSSYLFFMAEIIQQCVKEEQKDRELFDFIVEELTYLNKSPNSPNFLLYWLVQLSVILGINPHVLDKNSHDFDLLNGEIGLISQYNSDCISHEKIPLFASLIESDKNTFLSSKIDKETRLFFLNLLLDYYKIHITNFHFPKSLEIYKTIWYN